MGEIKEEGECVSGERRSRNWVRKGVLIRMGLDNSEQVFELRRGERRERRKIEISTDTTCA